MTLHYAHISEGRLRNAVKSIDRLFSEKAGQEAVKNVNMQQ